MGVKGDEIGVIAIVELEVHMFHCHHNRHLVGGDAVAAQEQMNLPSLHAGDAGGRFGQDLVDNAIQVGATVGLVPIAVILFQYHLIARLPGDKLEGACPHQPTLRLAEGLFVRFVVGFANHMTGRRCQGILPERIGLFEGDFDRPIAHFFDLVHTGIHPAKIRSGLRVAGALHAKDHIIQRHGRPIVESDALANGVAIGQRVRILPAFGQTRGQRLAIDQGEQRFADHVDYRVGGKIIGKGRVNGDNIALQADDKFDRFAAGRIRRWRTVRCWGGIFLGGSRRTTAASGDQCQHQQHV